MAKEPRTNKNNTRSVVETLFWWQDNRVLKFLKAIFGGPTNGYLQFE
jgi:hypothetical protein